ncbi:hypothetical protein BN85414290 [Alteracholeplasma palmae J233]|uniref:Uncharacterized protein n=1 Tax=Alteracholeplasma palmae (strain ATCC 49389 / J233) TaxID=1318466 RepID=U4KSH2_ALTPJ|nr:hypothetical protein [Alteracholeplasma palmae]CCV65006.1 hypothetical protein BN85414290 [Alteracholeplasma palmae J233]
MKKKIWKEIKLASEFLNIPIDKVIDDFCLYYIIREIISKNQKISLKGSSIFYYALENFWRLPSDIDIDYNSDNEDLGEKRKKIRKILAFNSKVKLKKNKNSNFQYLWESQIFEKKCNIKVECLVCSQVIGSTMEICVTSLLFKYAELTKNITIMENFPVLKVTSNNIEQAVIDKYLSIAYLEQLNADDKIELLFKDFFELSKYDITQGIFDDLVQLKFRIVTKIQADRQMKEKFFGGYKENKFWLNDNISSILVKMEKYFSEKNVYAKEDFLIVKKNIKKCEKIVKEHFENERYV